MSDKTFTGATLTSSDVNTYLTHTGGAWNSWTPVVTQSNTPALTNTRSRYFRAGRAIIGFGHVTMTGTGTSSNAVVVSLPVAMASVNERIIGTGQLYDASSGFAYYFDFYAVSTTTAQLLRRIDGAAGSFFGVAGFTAALANNDEILWAFNYEAAS